MIKAFQIQTINTCNSRCIMCPYPHIHKENIKMEDSLFIKIVDEITQLTEERVVENPIHITPFFQNEPFMDSSIFDRVEYIREKIPNADIEMFSNGILFEKYKDKIINLPVNRIKFSLYGYDATSFNHTTNLNISQDQFDSIYKAFEYIKDRAPFGMINDSPWNHNSKEIRGFSSRAGFLNNNKIYHKEIRGCCWHRDLWINFLADGSVPTCCMDWTKENILGNASNQTILEIINSKQRKDIIDTINGVNEMPDGFICSRCEKCCGDGFYERPDLINFNKD
jgi:hypothetical protein